MGSFTLAQPLDTIKTLVVTGGLNPRGPYNEATTYSKGDCVSYDGHSYILYQNNSTGNLPTNTDYWQPL